MSIILIILLALAIGIVAGVMGIMPPSVESNIDTLIMVMLCLLLFVIGLDMSQNKSVIKEMRRIGCLYT